MNDIHVLKTSLGITIEGRLDPESMQLHCEWSPAPPYPRKRFKRLMREYLPWRDGIIQAAVDRIGKSVLVMTPTGDGGLLTTVIRPSVEVGG